MVTLAAFLKGKLFFILLIGFVATVSLATIVTVALIRKPDDQQATSPIPKTTPSTSITESTSTIDHTEGSGNDGGEKDLIGSSILSKFLSVNSFTNGEEFVDHEDLISEGFMRIR